MSSESEPLSAELYSALSEAIRTVAPPAALLVVGGIVASLFPDQLVVQEPYNVGAVTVLIFASAWIGYRVREMEDDE